MANTKLARQLFAFSNAGNCDQSAIRATLSGFGLVETCAANASNRGLMRAPEAHRCLTDQRSRTSRPPCPHSDPTQTLSDSLDFVIWLTSWPTEAHWWPDTPIPRTLADPNSSTAAQSPGHVSCSRRSWRAKTPFARAATLSWRTRGGARSSREQIRRPFDYAARCPASQASPSDAGGNANRLHAAPSAPASRALCPSV